MKTPPNDGKMELEQAYSVLGLKYGATLDEVRQAFHQQALLKHPDKNRELSDFEQFRAEEQFKQINEAYHAILGTPLSELPHNSKPDKTAQNAKMDFSDFTADVTPSAYRRKDTIGFFWVVALLTPAAVLFSFNSYSWKQVVFKLIGFAVFVTILWVVKRVTGAE